MGVDTAETEPLKVTNSAARENTELIVNKLLGTDLAHLKSPQRTCNHTQRPRLLFFSRPHEQRRCGKLYRSCVVERVPFWPERRPGPPARGVPHRRGTARALFSSLSARRCFKGLFKTVFLKRSFKDVRRRDHMENTLSSREPNGGNIP